jgi:hypothetical protein
MRKLFRRVVLHYVLNLWVHQWRRRHAHGRVTIVPYVDDFVMGFEKEAASPARPNKASTLGIQFCQDVARI